MMDFIKSIAIAASGMRAESGRMRIISENIANADSTASSPGGDPFRRRIVTFRTELDRDLDAHVVQLGRIASLIGHSGSSAFRPTTTTAVSMSLTGSCFSSESAPGPSIMGVDDEAEQSTERPCCNERQVQAIGRTHLIHRPARDIIPPQGGARVSSYRM